ncbi:class I SAM-dependent methyltransferase [Changchengzhania lutea]|uniref:class I SAM-dependent methyltransferase n=1 Tax=Changchengzhania lutea TaxID=2049305 RepID=UPI00115F0D7B|nr:class I SAM-dependent methyltransferase [Changchengzhania lutea]
MDNFININFNKKSLDTYSIRKAILRALTKNLSNLSGNLLDIGCGKMPYKQYILKNSSVKRYIGLDIENAIEYDAYIKPDYTWDGVTMPFENNSFDCALGTEVLEHCPEPDIILNEIFRVLKPKGAFFFTVPFLWNLHEVPNDEYRYTPFSLERHLKNSGFKKIDIRATGGWHASMAQMMGLWVRRSDMSDIKRRILSRCIKPVMRFLIKHDKPDTVIFKEGQMITGLYGIAIK